MSVTSRDETILNAYFLSLEMRNIRCFGERQKIHFSDGFGQVRQWTIVLGNNGTGKTTLLQSLVAMIPVEESNDSSSPYYSTSDFSYKSNFVRKRFKSGEYRASFSTNLLRSPVQNKELLEFDCEVRPSEHIETREFGSFPVHSFVSSLIQKKLKMHLFAYGASRKTGETSFSEKITDPYATLFDETALLINPEDWLLQADYVASKPSEIKQWAVMRRERVIDVLKAILPDVSKIEFGLLLDRSKKPKVAFQTPYGLVESKDLSLGYRTSMAWIVDFCSRMFDLYPSSENPLAEPAIVLIDEIDLHLHPKWQRDLLPWLSDLFPNTQFVVTTHSPLIVQSAAAREANIVVCRRDGDHVVIDESIEAVENWRNDQILSSPLFGVSSRSKEIDERLEERRKILSKANLTEADEKKLEVIEAEIGSIPVMEDPKYDKAMDIILRAAQKLEENGAPK